MCMTNDSNSKNQVFHTKSIEETINLGKLIGSQLQGGEIFAMQGTLGAGKTTITKGIAEALKIEDTITSPTFCLISEYEGRLPLYHMDMYRLEGIDDFLNLGVEDMLYGKGVCLIEWSEKIIDELPKSTITLKLEPIGNSEERRIELTNWPYSKIDWTN